MKQNTIFFTLVFSFLILTKLNANPDTLIANIFTAQGHDTILAYVGNPNFVILDVRTPAEYTTHIEGAVNIDYNNPNFSSIIDSLNRNKIYLIHCAGGSRSAKARDTLQAKHFKTVYNMLGGISGWISAAYPTTASIAPELGLLTDSVIVFNNVQIGDTDSALVTVTNSKNSVLEFSSTTDLIGTEFSSPLYSNRYLWGARDYNFYIHFQPTDLVNDSIVYTIVSNGGTKHLYIVSKFNQTNINSTELNDCKIFANKQNSTINIYSNKSYIDEEIQIFDTFGRLLFINKISGNNSTINLNIEQRGLLFIKIKDNTEKIFW